MNDWLTMVITIVCSVLATSGFWTFIQSHLNKKSAQCEMLIGLGHDRIVQLGLCYIERGWITRDEYENFHDYLCRPYLKLGGNGTALKIIQEVEKLIMYRDKMIISDNNEEVTNA